MKNILRQIADILYYVPFMDRDIMISIIDPIDTIEQANRMLKFLEENRNNSNIMNINYLLPNKRRIIGVYR